ncbi:MAG: hypothetical protein JRE28_10430 [Deltaproteobacteria bacterium]|nr:hypothetical protein [Deltaproteobacteria bacterium]
MTIDSSPGTLLTVQSAGATNSTINMQCERYLLHNYTSYNTGAGPAPELAIRKARGTIASPAAVIDNDSLGYWIFRAHDGTAFRNVAGIQARVDGAVTTDDVPGELIFSTRQSGDANFRSVGGFASGGGFWAGYGISDSTMTVAGFVKNDAEGLLSGGNSIAVGDLPAHADEHEVGGGDLVDHDALTNFVLDEHVAHSGISVLAGINLTGGGTIDGSVTLNVDPVSASDWDAAHTHITSDGTDHTYIDQDVRTTASPTLAGLTVDADPGVLATFQSTGDAVNSSVLFRAERYLTFDLAAYRTSGAYAGLQFKRARGTIASPLPVAHNDELGTITFWGYDSSAFVIGASIIGVTRGTPAVGSIPTDLRFYTTEDGGSYSPKMALVGNGRLGIGVLAPNERLEVSGKIRTNAGFNLNGADGISSSAAGVITASTVAGGILTSVTKNDWLDQDVKTTASPVFAGLTVDTDTLYVDPVNNRVGVGTASPQRVFHVAAPVLPYIHLTNDLSGHGGSNGLTIGILGEGYNYSYIRVRENHPLKFYTNNTQYVTLLANGNLGIATGSPAAKLDTKGDARFGDSVTK